MRNFKIVMLASWLSLVSCHTSSAPPQPVVSQASEKAVSMPPPRLTVVLVVDQLRADEIEAYNGVWRGGFRVFVDEGHRYVNGMHSHGRTETAAGHATIGTGLAPRYHGIVTKSMYIPDRDKILYVCDYGTEPCTPDLLLAETIGDRLKSQSPASKVVSLAQKDRSAMLLGGRAADVVAWFDSKQPGLIGRSQGKTTLPAFMQRFMLARGAADRRPVSWELPKLPPPFNTWPDVQSDEGDCGFGTTFPHRIPSKASTAETYKMWQCLPDSDAALGELALLSAKQLKMGQDNIPDLLWVSFSTIDIVGHHYGYESLERAAALQALDRTIGDLITGLHRLVGSELLVVLTADHGVTPRAGTLQAQGRPGGRVNVGEIQQTLDAGLKAELGNGKYIKAFAFPYIWLEGADAAQKQQVVASAIKQLKADERIYNAWSTATIAKDPDPIAQLMAESVHPDRSGDIVIALKEGFEQFDPNTGPYGANHGMPWPDDRRVPVLLWGEGITPGRSEQIVRVTDLMRTVSDRLGLPADRRGGNALPQP